MAALAWNLSVAPPEMREEQLLAMEANPGTFSPPDNAARVALVKRLIRAKSEQYPDDRRLILKHKIQFKGVGVLPDLEVIFHSSP